MGFGESSLKVRGKVRPKRTQNNFKNQKSIWQGLAFLWFYSVCIPGWLILISCPYVPVLTEANANLQEKTGVHVPDLWISGMYRSETEERSCTPGAQRLCSLAEWWDSQPGRLRGAACYGACVRTVDWLKHFTTAPFICQLQLQAPHNRKASVTLVQGLEGTSVWNNVCLERMG